MTNDFLNSLAEHIRTSAVFAGKKDIRSVARELEMDFGANAILNGDDAAAIPYGDGYLLLAAEGIISELITTDPYLAGRSAVLASINDIYAMGGRPLAMVDVITNSDDKTTREICRGMKDNAARFNVPLVGGHTSSGAGETALSMAILGRAKSLLTSFDACSGDRLVLTYNPQGSWMGNLGFWNSNTLRSDSDLRADLELLPFLAERQLSKAGKDVSMAGIVGTALMLAETSGVGVQIDMDSIEPPEGVKLSRWIQAFFSYGFLLAVAPEKISEVMSLYVERGLEAKEIGFFHQGTELSLSQGRDRVSLWDWACEGFTGFSKP
jgi:AIR synthase-related protein